MAFSSSDESYAASLGISEAQLKRQWEVLKRGRAYVRLVAPCEVGHGVLDLTGKDVEELFNLFNREVGGLRPLKFVPASGAASRMFQDLILASEAKEELDRIFLSRHHIELDDHQRHLFYVFENLERFAFYKELEALASKNNLNLQELKRHGQISKILPLILGPEGLNYANLPKALVQFHSYHEKDVRTPLEEHLVEAAYYACGEDNIARVHYTSMPVHRELMEDHARRVAPKYEKRFQCQFDITFSIQDPSTDTIALEMDGSPVRAKDGSLLFRPGGHGSLLQNLQAINAWPVFIKNIDNVCHDHRKPDIGLYKKALGGLLLRLKRKINDIIADLSTADDRKVHEGLEFVKDELHLPVPELKGKGLEEKKKLLKDLILRPIRVCGVVEDVDEPGGAPFWVEDRQGNKWCQIVEKAQVDMSDPIQAEMFKGSRFFNPVDIVCDFFDHTGMAYDLKKFSEPEAMMISEKYYEGRRIRILEHPGLWNGQMAYWITVFVKVPRHTFTPVKTILDLLKEGHLSG